MPYHPNVYPSADVDGRPTFTATGRDVPVGWEARTNDESPWRVMELNPTQLYQCRPRMAADPIMPVDPNGSIVTTVEELLKRHDHDDWLWLTQDNRWLLLRAFPFGTFNNPLWPIRVKRIVEKKS